MSSALGKLLVKSTTRIIKNTAKFELAVDDLIEKFSGECPPKDELLKIVEQKNQIQSALQNVLGEFSLVNSTVNTTEGIVTSVGTAVKVIKSIPIPTSVPPGIGIPINVITLLADSLDTLGDLVKGAKASLKIVPPVAKTVTESAQTVIDKLSQLDSVLNECIEGLLDDIEWQPDIEYNTGDHVTFNGNYYASEIDLNLNIPPLPETVPASWILSDAESALNWLINQIGSVAAASGLSTNLNLNITNEEELIKRLQPGANPRYLYQKTGFPNADWLLTIEYNNRNEFTFPQRRIRAENINQFDGNPYKGIVVYNIYGKKYSYSTSVSVLVDESQFVIEQLDTEWYKNNNTEFNTSGLYNTQTEQIDRSSTSTTDTTSTTSTTPTPSVPIRFNMDNLKNNGTETRRMSLLSATAGAGNYGNLLSFINGRVITTQPSQSIEINVDTGVEWPRNLKDPFVKLEFTPDLLKSINPNQNPDFRIKTLSITNERDYTRKFTYNEPGEYTFKLKVLYQQDIRPFTSANSRAEAFIKLYENN